MHTQRMVQLPEAHPLYDLELKVRMLKAEVLETMLYGCVTWSTRACRYDTLRRAQQSFLTRCIGWRKNNRADRPISYLDTLIEAVSESIEATLRSRRILFAGFVARMEDTRLPKCVMFVELMGGAGCVGDQRKEWMRCFLDDFRAFGINAGVVQQMGGGGDTTIPSPGRSPKQPLPVIGLHDPLRCRQACSEFDSFHQEVGQICLREELFLYRPLPKRGQNCDIPAPHNR